MVQVLKLRKILNTMPVQFMLILKDPMKVENTEFGAERDIRARLKTIGILQPEIDELFQSANCTGK